MEALKERNLPVTGLKDGQDRFEFQLGKAFLDAAGEEEFQGGDVKAEVKRLTGDGVDVALECAGSPQALAQTIQVTRPRGNVVCGGNQPPEASLPMTFIEDLMRKELRLNGCFMSYSAPFPGHEWTESVARLLDGQLDMDTMISHRYPLTAATQVFEDIGARRIAFRKIILQPENN